ncbi:ABC transporter permease subunit [Streptomyces sp. NPDC059262]|uniref:ABC transporter permease subunit n=1 Tax=Streptomyces sp. NPDC059262 TaxID=3346797 RepID=UPI00368C3FCC
MVGGCGYWRVYWNIILPLSRPIPSALSVFFFLANWNAFAWPLVATATNGADLTDIQVGIASFSTQCGANWNYVLAVAVVVVIPMLALFLVFQRQMVESIKTSGLK